MTLATLATETPIKDVLPLWRRPGIDFDRNGEGTDPLETLLEVGGLFPFAKIEARLPFTRHALNRWCREGAATEMGSCFISFRESGDGTGKAMTVLVDLCRLNDLVNARVSAASTAVAGQRPRGHRAQDAKN